MYPKTVLVQIEDKEYSSKHKGKVIEYSIDERLKKKTDEKIRNQLKKKDKDFFAIVDGGEGCFFEDTLIQTNGGIFSIKDLVKENRFIINTIGLDLETKKKKIGKSKIIPSGKKEVYEIETIDGKKIIATLEHKFFVEREELIKEIRLKNLKIGDKLICEKKYRNYSTTEIKSIKKIGIRNTYDFRCYPTNNLFLANGILCHNSGKSTFAFQWAKYVDPTFNLKRIVFTPDEFKEAIFKAKNGEAIVYDEAFTGLSSRSALSAINRYLVSLAMQIRQKNLFIILALPSVFLLDKYFVMFRAKVLIHIYENKGIRGYFRVYNPKKIKRLVLEGKSTFSYSKKVRTNFKGRFYGKFALGDEIEIEYRKRKMKALEQSESNPMTAGQVKYREQRDLAIYLLRKETKWTYQAISNMLLDYGIDISYVQIRNICVKFGDTARKDDKIDKNEEKEEIEEEIGELDIPEEEIEEE